MAEEMRREVRVRLGTDSTFEERRDAAAEINGEVLWRDADGDLHGLVTDAEEVDDRGESDPERTGVSRGSRGNV